MDAPATPIRPILGVDPGVTGAVAFLWPDHVVAEDIPVVDGEVDVDALVRMVRHHAPCMAVIERAASRPGQGVASMFRFGVAYGAIRAVVAVSGIPTHLVSPAKWKRRYGLGADKEASRAMAIRLWPGCGLFARKKDHGRAEACLIARYGQDVIVG